MREKLRRRVEEAGLREAMWRVIEFRENYHYNKRIGSLIPRWTEGRTNMTEKHSNAKSWNEIKEDI